MKIFQETINLFRIQKEERKAFLCSLFFFVVLNALNIIANFATQSAIMPEHAHDCIKRWHLAGFDPITYSVLSDWNIGYNVYRHPLLAYFLWPFSKLNEALIALTGVNLAIIITALLLIFFATYSYIFLSRIFREIIGLRRGEACVLATLNFSFAFVMLSTLAPDHFCPSMFCLILTLYLCGRKLQRGRALNWWQTILMFFFTAGISLNNGLKIFLAALATRRKRFFHPGYLLVAVILPAALIWGSARMSYKHFVWPKEMATKMKAKEKRDAQLLRLQNCAISNINMADTARIAFVKDSVKKSLEAKREKRKQQSAVYKHTGKPFMQGEFMRWTDMTTNRWDVAVECLFGEGIMLHEDYLLGDVLVNRPVIVKYHNWLNYIVEAFIVGLFVLGIWIGRKSIFLWTALSMFLMDMALHMGLGFGINEISIMSPHYLFVLPIAIGFLLKGLSSRYRGLITNSICVVSAYLIIWNVTLLVEYLFII